jgi:hypothetical protein
MSEKVADASKLPPSKLSELSDFLAELDASRPGGEVHLTEHQNRLAEVAELLRPADETFPRLAAVLPPSLTRAVVTSGVCQRRGCSAMTERVSPGGVDSVKCERAFAPPGPLVAQSLKVQGMEEGSPTSGTLGLCSANIPLENPVGGLPGLGLFPTALESGFEQTAPGIRVPS